MDIRTTPLVYPLPDNPIKLAERFAHDLAWGAVNRLWSSHIKATGGMGSEPTWIIQSGSNEHFKTYKTTVWQATPLPDPNVMTALGFLDRFSADEFMVAPQSFKLLRERETPAKVFISYRHATSSAFALLLEARLKGVGVSNPFIDKNLVSGEQWHARLNERIKESEYFICLIAPETFASESWVRKEAERALATNCIIVPVAHNGARLATHADLLTGIHGLEVLGESAAQYDAVVNSILNTMGYSTY